MRTVVGYFAEREEAARAADALVDDRFNRDAISIIAHDGGRVVETHPDGQGMASGATTGAVMGGAFGVALGLGALVIPGIGPVLAAGPLAAAIAGGAAGVAAGGLAGGLVGALVDAGVSQDEARDYAEGVRRGGAILTVNNLTDAEAAHAERILSESGADDIRERATSWGSDHHQAPPA